MSKIIQIPPPLDPGARSHYLCDQCARKTFEDSSLSYKAGNANPQTGQRWPDGDVGSMAVLCKACTQAKEQEESEFMKLIMETRDELKRDATSPLVIRKKDLARFVGLSLSTITRMERADQFPRRIKLSDTTVGWLREDVVAWANTREPVDPPAGPVK